MSIEDNRDYRKGAVAARDFLRRTQVDLHLHRQFTPKVLRWEYDLLVQHQPPEYRAGFMDALGAYVLTTLEGVLVDLYRWQILRELERADDQN